MKYPMFWFTSHEQSSSTLSEKNKMFIYSLKYPNKDSEKIFKNEAAESYLEPCEISMMERFSENTTAKSFIKDVWYGSKYIPEVM